MKLKPLVQMMAMLPVMFFPTTATLHASDLSIYKGNTTGKTSILLMLDTSGSMGISSLVLPKNNPYGSPGDVDEALCDRVLVQENYSNDASTGIYEWAYNLKDPTNNDRTASRKTVTIGGTVIPYYVRGCTKGGVTQYDRLSRLKDAILPLLAESPTTGLPNSVVMGLGQFSSRTDLTIGSVPTKFVDGHSGRIVVPNMALATAQRIKIAQALASIKSVDTSTNEDGTSNSNLKISSKNYPDIIKASSGTPTAHAYAEAAAYMMGTNTGGSATLAKNVSFIYDGYMLKQKGSEQIYFLCATSGGGTTYTLGATVKQCPSDWPEWDDGKKTVKGTIIFKPYDGSCTKANSPNQNWCSVGFDNFKAEVGSMSSLWDAYKKLPVGWRFDGWVKVPTEPMDIEPVVGTVWGYPDGISGLVSYRTSPFSLDGTTDNTVGGFTYSAADSKGTTNYIAGGSNNSCDGNGIYFLTDGAPNSTKDSMARTILNHSLLNSAYQFALKPSGTGVLASPILKSDLFAGETGGWEYIGEYAKKLRNRTETSNTQKNPLDMNIKTAVVGFGASFSGLTKNTDGTYNCESAPNADAKNACIWGSKEYGDGGFYFAENSEDIKNSIIKFVEDVTPAFASGSLGSISVPSDPLDQTRLMTTGFFPMVQPVDGAKIRTWAGNLKKYNIIGGTLKDVSNNAIYSVTNGKQVINKSAKDLWSSVSETDADHSSVESGGSWSKIPTPSLLNVLTDPSSATSVRNVFTMDGATLRPITKENLATDYTEANGVPALNSTNINVQKRYALLNYLGYQSVYPSTKTTITTTDINTLSTTKPNIPYRYLGGVVHSTPLVVTKKAVLESDSNAVSSRNEYVVYGSMEGGLHIVDGSTGIEQSVFVPQEILSNQPETLASIKASSDAGLAHGVDAPWVADNTFKLETQKIGDVDVTQYTANKMNIYGGLRMGGKAIYGLNIINPAKPTLLFQINNTTTGFDRLSQVWSKPTLADIRVAGVRQKVLIFGGGYDESIYEKDGTAFTEPTTATKGNALYIVNANTGVLIKSISSSSTGATGDQAEVKYSVVGQPVVLDYDSDGLADMIYFADLGGQMFRVDLNNAAQSTTVSPPDVMVRVKRISNLKETNFVPRFYDRLTAAVFDKGQDRFVLVTGGSGNRSYPLASAIQRNKIYGILDYNAATNGLEKSSFTAFDAVATSSNLANRGVLGRASSTLLWGTGSITNDQLKTAMAPNGTLRGWRFDLLSSQDKTNENYAKSFEESQLVSGDLYVNAYDPKSTLSGVSNECGGGVQGISTTHRICAPYADCAAYLKTSYEGISGPALGSTGSTSDPRQSSIVGPIAGTIEACIGKCGTENNPTLQEQAGKLYSKSRVVQMNRWFEK